jgi:NADH-quinone oxidoreductase subunit M
MHLTDYIAWTPMVILIVVLGLYPNLLFKITDGAVVQSLTAFASGG